VNLGVYLHRDTWSWKKFGSTNHDHMIRVARVVVRKREFPSSLTKYLNLSRMQVIKLFPKLQKLIPFPSSMIYLPTILGAQHNICVHGVQLLIIHGMSFPGVSSVWNNTFVYVYWMWPKLIIRTTYLSTILKIRAIYRFFMLMSIGVQTKQFLYYQLYMSWDFIFPGFCRTVFPGRF